MGPSNPVGNIDSRSALSSAAQIRSFTGIRSRFLRTLFLFSFTALVWSAVAPFEGVARAQAFWAFHCSAQVRWGDASLSVGDYVFSVSASDPRLVTVYQSSGRFVAKIVAQQVTPGQSPGPTFVFTADDGDGSYVTSAYVSDVGSTLTFTKPTAKSQAAKSDVQEPSGDDAASGDGEPTPGMLFAIHNSTNETVPYVRAEALYLSACKVVEQEFRQSNAVRPRVTLSLGAAVDRVDFPKHEIQLKKWSGYQFAQGVVLLAVDDLLPIEKRISLTKLAVTEAESTIDLSELRNERVRGATGP